MTFLSAMGFIHLFNVWNKENSISSQQIKKVIAKIFFSVKKLPDIDSGNVAKIKAADGKQKFFGSDHINK
jgi:hypothetical protein